MQKLLIALLVAPFFCGVVVPAMATGVAVPETVCASSAEGVEDYEVGCTEKRECTDVLNGIVKEEVTPCEKEIRKMQQRLDSMGTETEEEKEALKVPSKNLKTAIEDLQKINQYKVIPLKVKIQSLQLVVTKKILTINEQAPFGSLSGFIGGVIDILVKMVAVIAFALLVVGGFRLIAAAGNDNQIQKAKTMITYSIAGLAIVLLAYVIVLLVQTVLYH